MKHTRDFVSEVKRKGEKRHEELVKFRVIAEVADPDDQITFRGYALHSTAYHM
jgi:hypothetical protein